MMQCLSEKNTQWINSILEALDKSDIAAVMSYISGEAMPAEMLPYKFHLLGLSAIRIGNFSEALSLFKQASDANPNSKIHFEACSFCAAKLGMLSDSMYYMKMSATCEAASEFDLTLLPDWMGTVEDQVANIEERPFFKEAQASFATGNLQKTVEHLQQALNADPFNVESWLLIYRTMLLLDRKYDAIQAVKAACDSGDVSIDIRTECAFYAAQLGLKVEVENLISPTDEHDLSNIHDPQKIIILEQSSDAKSEYVIQKEKWISTYISSSSKDNELPFLGKKVRLGIFSNRLCLNQGTDPIVNFLIDICSSDLLPWLSVYVYSGSEFMDVNTRRLASVAYEFRSVNDIDPLTLSRIMKNDGLHFMWDLDGFNFGGKPAVHAETSIPFRWISRGSDNADYNFTNMNEDANHSLLSRPYSMPTTFDVTDQSANIDRDIIRIATPLYPNQITDEFLNIFCELKKKHPEFVLVLDTKRMGGVSYVEQVEGLFAGKGLQNFIEFVEPYENSGDYQKALYGMSDYALVPESQDELQISYLGILHNCRLMPLGREVSFSNSVNRTGSILPEVNPQEGNKEGLLKIFDEESQNKGIFYERLAEQSHQISELNSMENRKKRILDFGNLLKGNIKGLYGQSVSPMLFSKDVSQ